MSSRIGNGKPVGITQAARRGRDVVLLARTASARPFGQKLLFANQARPRIAADPTRRQQDLRPHRAHREAVAPALAPAVDQQADDGERSRGCRGSR